DVPAHSVEHPGQLQVGQDGVDAQPVRAGPALLAALLRGSLEVGADALEELGAHLVELAGSLVPILPHWLEAHPDLRQARVQASGGLELHLNLQLRGRAAGTLPEPQRWPEVQEEDQ